jgi:hypothetical protein
MRHSSQQAFPPISLFLFLLFVSLTGFAQQNSETKQIAEWSPLFYLDSVNIGSQFQFDPNKIADLQIVNNYYDSVRHIHGKIFMKSKNPGSYKFLGIADLGRIYNMADKAPTIFMLNNEFLNDTSNFEIDSSYVLRVKFIRASEIVYLKDRLPDLIIEKIITRTKENIDQENQVRIRGKELSYN